MNLLLRLLGLTLLIMAMFATPMHAQEETPAPAKRPFQLPFAQPAGLNTWLMAQPYGNTTGAYRQRFSTYGASGGIHFGVDLSAPCGTEAVAMADGVVFAIDGPYGSPPHNLMIDHPELGYAAMYGHLLQRPALQIGQAVKQGEVVALTGDSEGTCEGRPHLHLEFRDLAQHARKYNPAILIEANWDSLALTGNMGRDFARDLTAPRQWQSLYDQPEAATGGPIINDFDYVWPFDWQTRRSLPLTPVNTGTVVSLPAVTQTTAHARQLTSDDCCTRLYWSRDSSQVRFIDQPTAEAALGIWGVTVTKTEPISGAQLISRRLGSYSPDGTLLVYPNPAKRVAVIERLADGQSWEINTQGRALNFTPDGQHLTWLTYNDDTPNDNRLDTLWYANLDGTAARALLTATRTTMVTWLNNEQLLMRRSMGNNGDKTILFTLSITDRRQIELPFQLPELREVSVSPDKRYLIYLVRLEPVAEENGLWLVDLQAPEQPAQKLPFFGTYRWRDHDRLVYVPFDPQATEHNFYEYTLSTGLSRALFPTGTGLTIANNEWQISPDGSQIALLTAKGLSLDGIWLVDLPK